MARPESINSLQRMLAESIMRQTAKELRLLNKAIRRLKLDISRKEDMRRLSYDLRKRARAVLKDLE